MGITLFLNVGRFKVMTPYGVVSGYQHYGEAWCVRVQNRSLQVLLHEDRITGCLRIVGNDLKKKYRISELKILQY
jgi:hypothetical protein